MRMLTLDQKGCSTGMIGDCGEQSFADSSELL
jgi:hypothetical protein